MFHLILRDYAFLLLPNTVTGLANRSDYVLGNLECSSRSTKHEQSIQYRVRASCVQECFDYDKWLTYRLRVCVCVCFVLHRDARIFIQFSSDEEFSKILKHKIIYAARVTNSWKYYKQKCRKSNDNVEESSSLKGREFWIFFASPIDRLHGEQRFSPLSGREDKVECLFVGWR